MSGREMLLVYSVTKIINVGIQFLQIKRNLKYVDTRGLKLTLGSPVSRIYCN